MMISLSWWGATPGADDIARERRRQQDFFLLSIL
jgi:hypothetical protein